MTYKNSLLLLALLIGGIVHANAQSDVQIPKKNSIEIKAGINHTFFKDLNYSPLNHSGSGPGIGLQYQRITKQGNLISASLGFSVTTLKSPASIYFDASRYLANLEANYLKRLDLGKEGWKLHVGGGYHSYVDVLFYDGTEAISFFTIHGIDLAAKLSYQIKAKHSLGTSLSIPILGLLVRPPYTGWDKFIGESQDAPAKVFFRGNWTSLNDFLGLNWNLSYAYDLSPAWDLIADYSFQYYRTSQLDLVNIANNQLRVGASFNF